MSNTYTTPNMKQITHGTTHNQKRPHRKKIKINKLNMANKQPIFSLKSMGLVKIFNKKVQHLHHRPAPHGLVLSLGNWSAMSTIRWVFLLLLFWRKSGYSDSKVFIPLSAHGLTSLPHPYRLHSYVLNTHHFPCVAKHHGLATLLLLCGDISLNPGPVCKKQGTVHQ